jgi:NAD+ synthase (glutamine-hydrolysing)
LDGFACTTGLSQNTIAVSPGRNTCAGSSIAATNTATVTLNIAIAQINLMVGDVAGNARRVIESARHARDVLKARAVIFPELTLTGYPPEDLLLRPELDERVARSLDEIAAEVPGIDVVLGYPRVEAGLRFNAAGVIRDGRLIAEYHKALLPNYSVFDEKRYFEPGGEPCIFEIDGLRVGLTVCEDIWFSQPAADAAAAGAQVVFNLNASPFHKGKAPEREELLRKRATESGVTILYVNLVGGQDELVFDGGSFVTAADGSLTQREARFVETVSLVQLDAGSGQPLPGAIAPHLEAEEIIYQALVTGVRDYVRKNGFKGVVLGLSGGIDSALTLAVAVDALGPDAVEVVLMPSRYTADMSNEDAARQADSQGVQWCRIPIEPAFNSFLEMLADEFTGLPMDVTEENIQARCRGIILMAISNKSGRMLLTTGNKSEVSVGYTTLYGDMAGGFAPLKDVPKTLVYRLAEWRNRDGEVIPWRVIERPPSAELRPDQQDTDSLPAYDVLDAILEHYVELDQSVAEIIDAGFDAELVKRITRMVDRNEYKRRQAPPGIKITRRAFGRDRRYPITNGF